MNCIVMTTINPPTEAVLKFSKFIDMHPDWEMIIVGDLKTPHDTFKNINCHYFHPEEQEKKYPELSKALGWNLSPRRNIGFVEAYHRGAEIIALVDDDNIPYETWGKNLLVGKESQVSIYETSLPVADPLYVTAHKHLWHRGFPIELVSKRNAVLKETKTITPLVQASLWDGDPDIDAVERLIYAPEVAFNNITPYAFNTISPFNSQNTFISRKAISKFLLIPGIGRIDDIWGSYLLQKSMDCPVVYTAPTVYQKRNAHNLITDLEQEMYGYKNTMSFIKNTLELPPQSKDTIQAYYASY